MNKLANALCLTGLVLALASLASQAFGYLAPDAGWSFLGSAADEVLMLSAILVLGGLWIKCSATSTRVGLGRDARALFWIGALLVLGLSSCLVAEKMKGQSDQELVREFQKLYHSKIVWESSYLGVPAVQFPSDTWVLQEMLAQIRPDFLVETGTGRGGTTLFFATVLDQLNAGRIITVDIEDHDPKVKDFDVWRKRVEFLKGSSTAPEIVDKIASQVKGRKVLVTLDSEHTKEHVLKELELYAPLVTVGSYIVVQDTHLNGHPVPWPRLEKTGGPMEAVVEFLENNKNFEADRSWEKHLVTQNPRGFLKRIS
jgi:cephalosporin hydroxylase